MLLEIRPAAKEEFDEASDWYRNENPAIRDAFVSAVGRMIVAITDRPLAFPIVFGSSVRRAVVNKFPFSIFFTLDDDLVIILSIFHNSRNPMIWRERIG